MNLNILSVIIIFVLFIPVSFANGADDFEPVYVGDGEFTFQSDSTSKTAWYADVDDSVFDNRATEALEKSQVESDSLFNSILINNNDRIYLFSQTIQRDSNGNLVAFFQSDKMTQISPSTIHYFLDARSLLEPIPVYDFNGTYVQAYGEEFSNIIPLKDITASTMLVIEIVDTGNLDVVPPSLAARHAHDGIVLEPGDIVSTYWWVARVLN
jgi:hypothetical protein